jgi:hypothetical protein
VPDRADPSTPDAVDDLFDGERLVIRLRLPLAALTDPPPPGARRMRVTTEGAVYEFDPRTMTAVRLHRSGPELRRDAEPLTLLGWPTPVVGVGMTLYLIVREDTRAPTVRTTSPVLGVDHLDGDLP